MNIAQPPPCLLSSSTVEAVTVLREEGLALVVTLVL